MAESLTIDFRPMSLRQVVGQEPVVRVVTRHIEDGNIAPLYVFMGQYGTGKTTMARLLAMRLNCENVDPDNYAEPCGKCETCKVIHAGGTNGYVHEMDAASSGGKDDVKKVLATTMYSVPEGCYRVIIVDEAQALSNAAGQTWMKSLEEPPPRTTYVFCTTEPNKVPKPVLSRAKRLQFTAVDTDKLVTHLERVARSAGLDADTEAFYLAAKLSEGSVRDALNILETGVAAGKVTAETISVLHGVVPFKTCIKLMDTAAAGSAQVFFDVVNPIFRKGVMPADIWKNLLETASSCFIQWGRSDSEKRALRKLYDRAGAVRVVRWIELLTELINADIYGYPALMSGCVRLCSVVPESLKHRGDAGVPVESTDRVFRFSDVDKAAAKLGKIMGSSETEGWVRVSVQSGGRLYSVDVGADPKFGSADYFIHYTKVPEDADASQMPTYVRSGIVNRRN